MSPVLFFSVLLVVLVTAQVDQDRAPPNAEWDAFKSKFNRTYANSSEEARRQQIFLDSLMYIFQHNQRYNQNLETFEIGINQFADITLDEYNARFHGFDPNPLDSVNGSQMTPDPSTNNSAGHRSSRADLPVAVDWRNSSCVGPVKHQGDCGSCYAFPTSTSVEAIKCIKTGEPLVRLSEQQLVDCTNNDKYGNHGCRDGFFTASYKYIKENGLETAAAYPYTAKEGRCQFNSEQIRVKIADFKVVPKGEELELAKAVTLQPVAVGIDASHYEFMTYKSGIYYNTECRNYRSALNHAVIIVGYGSEGKDKDYWIVQNSHGVDWGEQGYMRIAKNKDNHCGVATHAHYPIY